MAPIKQKKGTFELSVFSAVNRAAACEILTDLLLRCGVPLEGMVQWQRGRRSGISVYFRCRSQMAMVCKRAAGFGLKGIQIRQKALAAADWQERWKEDFKPFQLTAGFDVIPFAYRLRRRTTGRCPIFIDTTLAFGTGLHETTRFMAELIERCAGKFSSFLDIGTGTGILSIVAFHCGAKTAVGIDLDRKVLTIARANLAANGMRFNRVIAGNFRDVGFSEKFDFVAANLITEDLCAMRRRILAAVKRGQYLAVSGIACNHLRRLKDNFRTLPLRTLKICQGRDWAAVLYKRI